MFARNARHSVLFAVFFVFFVTGYLANSMRAADTGAHQVASTQPQVKLETAPLTADPLHMEAALDEPKAAPTATRDVRIVINLPACQLDYLENGKIVKSYPIAIAAKKYAMPMGARSASHIIYNPRWTPPPSDWARKERPYGPGEKGNPLGRVKIPMGGYYLIHGGGDRSVGRAVSHGCIRMRNADVLELARLIIAARALPVSGEQIERAESNTRREYAIKIDPTLPVEIHYRSIQVSNGEIKIHPDIYGRGTNSVQQLKEALASSGIDYDALSMEERLTLLRAVKKGRKSQSFRIGGRETQPAMPISINF